VNLLSILATYVERATRLEESKFRARLTDGAEHLAAKYKLDVEECAEAIGSHGLARAEKLAECAKRFGLSLSAVSAAVRALGMLERKAATAPVVCNQPGLCGYTGSGEFTCSKCKRQCCWCIGKACSKLCDECAVGGEP
jgi:hypothetical protein